MRDYLEDESGQSTTEVVLLIAFMSLPLYILVRTWLDTFMVDYIESIIKKFPGCGAGNCP